MVKFKGNDLEEIVEGLVIPFKGVRGSIIRIRIRNFVTYRDVELRAGPNINLILGPNGTGKSTIVSAICLVLGGKTKILGRASNIREFIRHGSKKASVEIELYNPKGTNYVVKREITESLNTNETVGAITDWYLQGKPCKTKQIDELMESLNIQLDNLCQFLPQDRVQEFSKMDSIALLKSTESAAGTTDLASKHEALINYNSNVKKLEFKIGTITETLRLEVQKNQRLESEVQTYQERKELTNKIGELNGKKLWVLYQGALAKFTALKEQEKEIVKRRTDVERDLAPLKKALGKLETDLNSYREQVSKARSSIVTKTNLISRRYGSEREGADTDVNEIQLQVEMAVRAENEKQGKLEHLELKIRGHEEEVEEMIRLVGVAPDMVQNKLNSLNTQRSALNKQIIELNSLDEQDREAKGDEMRRIEAANSELRRMENMKDARLKYLERHESDVYKTYRFFERPENRAKLRGKLWDPMILHVFVHDLKYGPVAERHIKKSDILAFFCEEKEDILTFSQICESEIRTRVSVIHHPAPRSFVKPKASFSRDFLRKYKFEKVLIDLLEAPEYYMAYIVPTFHPEDVPMGSGELEQDMETIMEETDLRTFYSDENAYNIRTSAYSGEKFSTIQFLPTAKIFTTKINAVEVDKIHEVIRSATEAIQGLDESIRGRGSRIGEIRREAGVLEEELRRIREKNEHRIKTEQRVKNMKAQYERLAAERIDLEEIKRRTRADIYKRRCRVLDILETGERSLSELGRDSICQTATKHQLTILQSKIITKQAHYDNAKASLVEINSQLKGVSSQVKSAAEESGSYKEQAREKTGLDQPPPDVLSNEVDEASLERELSLAQVRLGFLTDPASDIMRRYEERQRDIAALEADKERKEAELLSLTSNLESTKASWLGPLNELIERINVNFSKFFASMCCAGQVQLDTGVDENDYSKYGIKIKVKFRATEQLAELSGWKQSGGERAITTALYVLALQELTTVPFRVIDEINQGMDAKNEARFFNLLCSLAKGEDTPQYFLLTPKMLPLDVNYPDNVEFHFIFSGSHVMLKHFRDTQGAEFSHDEEEEEENEEENEEEDDE